MKTFEELEKFVMEEYTGIKESRTDTLIHLRHSYLAAFADNHRIPEPKLMANVVIDLLELPEEYASVPHDLFIGAIKDDEENMQLIFGIAFLNEDESKALCIGAWESKLRCGFRSFGAHNSKDHPTFIQDAIKFDIERIQEYLLGLDDYVTSSQGEFPFYNPNMN